jgi:hypothetical protein
MCTANNSHLNPALKELLCNDCFDYHDIYLHNDKLSGTNAVEHSLNLASGPTLIKTRQHRLPELLKQEVN